MANTKIQIKDPYGKDARTYANDEISLMLDGRLPENWLLNEKAVAVDKRMMDAIFSGAVHVVDIVVQAPKVKKASEAKAWFEPLMPIINAANARGILKTD